jgi:hypothetical protein
VKTRTGDMIITPSRSCYARPIRQGADGQCCVSAANELLVNGQLARGQR